MKPSGSPSHRAGCFLLWSQNPRSQCRTLTAWCNSLSWGLAHKMETSQGQGLCLIHCGISVQICLEHTGNSINVDWMSRWIVLGTTIISQEAGSRAESHLEPHSGFGDHSSCLTGVFLSPSPISLLEQVGHYGQLFYLTVGCSSSWPPPSGNCSEWNATV